MKLFPVTEDQKKLISRLEDILSKTHDLNIKDELETALKLIMVDAKCVMDTLSRLQEETGVANLHPLNSNDFGRNHYSCKGGNPKGM